MKSVFPYLMMVVFLAIFVLAIVYISRRFAFYFSNRKAKSWYIIFASLFVLMITGGMVFQNASGLGCHSLYIASAFLMGFLLFLLILTLVADLVRLVVKTKPEYYGMGVVGLAVILSIYGLYQAFDLKTTRVDITLKGLNQEMKIMHLSDIHIGHFRSSDFIQDIVDRTNRLSPDLVCITGDYMDGKIALKDKNFEPLKQLKAPAYFIGGNHDEYTGLEAIKTKLRRVGVRVLENEVVGLGEIQLAGLSYMHADEEAFDMHPSGGKQTIKEVMPGLKLDESKPAVLLHHSPVGLNYAEEKGVDLYLAGHTHAGQIFPINLIGKLFFPYDAGLYEYGDMKIFVSGGAGTYGPPMRLGTKSEITLITLKPES